VRLTEAMMLSQSSSSSSSSSMEAWLTLVESEPVIQEDEWPSAPSCGVEHDSLAVSAWLVTDPSKAFCLSGAAADESALAMPLRASPKINDSASFSMAASLVVLCQRIEHFESLVTTSPKLLGSVNLRLLELHRCKPQVTGLSTHSQMCPDMNKLMLVKILPPSPPPSLRAASFLVG
jgi:hypothetical protein